MGKKKRRDRGYAEKRRQPWEERHKQHTYGRPVSACPLCNPRGRQPDGLSNWVAEQRARRP